MFGNLIEASKNQITQAIELTKLITDKNQDTMDATDIFAIFNKSMEVIMNSSPVIKDLWKKFPKD